MKQFLTKHLVKSIFVQNSITDPNKSYIQDSNRSNLIEDPLVQKIISLPDKLASINNLEYFFCLEILSKKFQKLLNLNFVFKSSLFQAKNYFKIISADLWYCLKHVHQSLVNLKYVGDFDNCVQIDLISSVYGKMCIYGYSG